MNETDGPRITDKSAIGNMNALSFALRQLRKNPGFAAVALLTLALGIGAKAWLVPQALQTQGSAQGLVDLRQVGKMPDLLCNGLVEDCRQIVGHDDRICPQACRLSAVWKPYEEDVAPLKVDHTKDP